MRAERARIPLEQRHGEKGGDEGAGQEKDRHRGQGFHRRRVVLGGGGEGAGVLGDRNAESGFLLGDQIEKLCQSKFWRALWFK